MDPLLSQGTALVTGSASGIGREIALAFVRHGCRKLLLADISADGIEGTKAAGQEIAPDAEILTHTADISDEESVKNLIDTCIQKFGRLDFACNNAGIVSGSVLTHEMELKDFQRLNHINARGTFLCERYEVKAMLQQEPLTVPGCKYSQRGSIVNTASMASLTGVSTVAGYVSSKHQLTSMTRVDARQYGEQGIRINNVCPGYINTPMMQSMSPEWVTAAARKAPMNRLIDPVEVANVFTFLSGSLASGVTGISLPVDGGALLYNVV